MKSFIVSFLLIGTLASCDAVSEKAEKDSYEKSKETLAEKEAKNPKRFLVVTSNDKKNLIGQTVIKGTITNTATVCWYKDVVLKLSFYSKTKVLLEEGGETIYELIGPNNNKKFKTKYFAPKGTDSVAIVVTGATVAKNGE
jgi:hypothetical protein